MAILDDWQREYAQGLVERERRRRESEIKQSLAAAAERSVRIFDCGCEEPDDYLTRPLESAHRCPNPRPRF